MVEVMIICTQGHIAVVVYYNPPGYSTSLESDLLFSPSRPSALSFDLIVSFHPPIRYRQFV